MVIRTGRTMGLEWEVERAVSLLTPERLVLLVDNSRELKSVLARIRRLSERAEPPADGVSLIGSVRGFIVFDQGWQASCLRARGPGFYFFCTDSGQVGHTAKRLARTLRPVFRTLGTRWQKPPLNWPLIVLSALTAGLFLFAIVAGILISKSRSHQRRGA